MFTNDMIKALIGFNSICCDDSCRLKFGLAPSLLGCLTFELFGASLKGVTEYFLCWIDIGYKIAISRTILCPI